MLSRKTIEDADLGFDQEGAREADNNSQLSSRENSRPDPGHVNSELTRTTSILSNGHSRSKPKEEETADNTEITAAVMSDEEVPTSSRNMELESVTRILSLGHGQNKTHTHEEERETIQRESTDTESNAGHANAELQRITNILSVGHQKSNSRETPAPESRRDTPAGLFIGRVIEDEEKASCCSLSCFGKKKTRGNWTRRLGGMWGIRGFRTFKKPRDQAEVVSPPPWAHEEDYPRGKKHLSEAELRNELQKQRNKKARVVREKRVIKEEKFDFTGASTLFGKLTKNMLPQASENIFKDADFKEQASIGAKLIDNMTDKPLTKKTDLLLHIFVHSLFFANLVAEIWDLKSGPDPLRFKATAVFIGVLENLVVWIGWAVMKHPKITKSENYAKHKKHQQYLENVVAEIMIYPMVLLTVIGFASGRDYELFEGKVENKDIPLKVIKMVLLFTDTMYLIITQTIRLKMLYQLLKDIHDNMKTEDELNLTGNWSLAGRVMPRAYFTVVGNIVLFIFLIGMFGAQVHKDNFGIEDEKKNHILTMASGVIMVCLLLLPFYSVLLFVLVNYFWIMEIVLNINMSISKQSDLEEKFTAYGDVVKNAISVAKEKMETTKEKYELVTKTPVWRKATYGLSEVYIIFLLFLYQGVMVGAIYVFEGFDNYNINTTIKVVFGLLLVVFNGHVILMALLSNAVLAILGIGICFYPVCILICCSQQLKEEIDLEEGIEDGGVSVSGDIYLATTARDVEIEDIEDDTTDANSEESVEVEDMKEDITNAKSDDSVEVEDMEDDRTDAKSDDDEK